MKKVFQIYSVVEKKVCTPSDDYYATDKWYEETVKVLELIGEYDTEEEAVDTIAKDERYEQYTILPVYVKTK